MFERFTVTARLAVVGAQEQARRRGDDRIRTEHLLLALYDVPDHLAGTVLDVLGDPSYRRNAERLRDEIATLPGPEYAVALLERLAAEKQPLLA